ncbi:hypothetical protein OAP87_07190, partial [Flavobacteriaceae bacterium]|nr:hypothetical protein [Flavobacteriaceae bacterium]
MKQKYFLKIAFYFLLISNISYGQITTTYDFSSGSAVTGLNETSPGISIDTNIGFGSFKNSSSSNPAIYSDQLRLYQNATKGGSIKVYANNGVTITQIVVKASGRTGPAGYYADDVFQTNLTNGTTYTMSNLSATSSIEFYQRDSNSSNRIYVDEIEITYIIGGGSNPTTTFDSATSSETETDATFATSGIPITLTNYAADVTVTAAVNGGSTAEAGDYTIDLTPLVFDANETLTIPLSINDDADFDDETIVIDISVTSGTADLGTSTHTVTITDDETPPVPTLIITEVADPVDDTSGRFLEIYNNGDSSIDLDAFEVYFVKSTNAGSSYPELALTGTILPNQVMTIASSSNMNSTYGFTPDFNDSDANGNGDDAYYLYFGGGRTSGDILDAYGAIGVDGTGQAWEYEDSRAIRLNPTTISPNATWTSGEWTIESGDLSDMTPGALENEYRYDGDWKPRNISNASSSNNAYITSDVTLTGSLSINNFEVTSGNVATINGTSLIVNGTSSGNVTYNRTLATENWYLVSSPVVGQDIDAFVASEGLASGTGSNVGLSDYNNATPGWSYYQIGASGTGSFTSGDGRAIKLASTGDVSFTGTINTSDVTVAMTSNSNGFNLVGNPYTSYVAGNENADGTNNILTINSASLTENTLWFWNQSTDSYDQINQSSTAFQIAPAQGFFVSASGSVNLSITEAMQSNQETDSFQRLTTRPEIELTLSNDTATRNADIYYIEGTTTGWDNGYDSSIFGGVTNEFAIYTHAVANGSGRNLGIQSLPNNDFENIIIPVGINAESGTAITIDASIYNFPSGINIYLEDKQDNSFTLLEADANFSTTLENNLNGIGRFYLHTTTSSLSTNDLLTSSN